MDSQELEKRVNDLRIIRLRRYIAAEVVAGRMSDTELLSTMPPRFWRLCGYASLADYAASELHFDDKHTAALIRQAVAKGVPHE